MLTTCVHAQRHGARSAPGDSVAIVGLGVTGLLHLQLAKLRGRVADRLHDEEPARSSSVAPELGADVPSCRRGPEALEQLQRDRRTEAPTS